MSRNRKHHNTHHCIFQNRTIETVNEHTHTGLIWNSKGNCKNHLFAWENGEVKELAFSYH